MCRCIFVAGLLKHFTFEEILKFHFIPIIILIFKRIYEFHLFHKQNQEISEKLITFQCIVQVNCLLCFCFSFSFK